MKYLKPPLTFEQQVKLLLDRGMVGDCDVMAQRLSTVNYYRLSGYWFHNLDENDRFRPGTRFDDVWLRYVFDRKLRLIVMDAVERIEIAVRTVLSYYFAHAHGPFAYTDEPNSLPALTSDKREKLLWRITQEIDRSKREQFIHHFREKYGSDHGYPPIWMATEVMSFGSVLSILKACSNAIKKRVAQPFEIAPVVLMSWLWSLNEVRNICAHHGRLWNRPLGNKPMIPFKKHQPDWHVPVTPNNERIFCVLTLCAHCLARISPGSTWSRRVCDFLDEYKRIPKKTMGFPDNWEHSPIWENVAS